MKVNQLNTFKYAPISFKAEASAAPSGTIATTNNSNSDTFEKSTAVQADTTTVNKVITSFKSLFATKPNVKTRTLSEKEISDLIFSRNLLL